jgi:hypothetical protein
LAILMAMCRASSRGSRLAAAATEKRFQRQAALRFVRSGEAGIDDSQPDDRHQ